MTIKAALKKILEFIVPAPLWLRLMAIRSRRTNQKLWAQWGCFEVNHRLLERFGSRTLAGPFAGMRLAEAVFDSYQIGPELLGTYEMEIAPWFLRLKGRQFGQVLDVGSCFGYYAVGLAAWFPDTPVIAFDTDPWAQKMTLAMAAENKTGNLLALGYCDQRWLNENMRENALIICDCEGFEFELLDPQRVPALRTATVIVESHDGPPWRKHSELIKKFEPTHLVSEESFNGKDRDPAADLSFLSKHEVELAVGEFRVPCQKWLFFEPKH